MKRLGWLLVLILVSLVVNGAISLRNAQAQSGPGAEILRLVNQVRAEHGLPPYAYNGTLSAAAQNHATWMATNVIYSHTGAGGSRPQDRASAAGYNGAVAENIVGGSNMTPNQGVIWWRNSALHYSMMVSSRYSEAGVGFATNGSQNMYVLVMGRPAGSGPQPAAPAEEPQAEPLIITPIELAQPREDGAIVHVVQEGQALWQIAAHYETTVDELLYINSRREDDILQPGDEVFVRLPDGAPPPPTPTPPLTHIVREGENAWMIAARYDVPLDTFFYLNNLTEDSMLHPGNEVKIRLAEGEPPPPTPTPIINAVVESGDSLWAIAAEHGVTLEQLTAWNNLSQDAILTVGQELLVVEPTSPPTATPTVVPATTTPEASTPMPSAGGSSAIAASLQETAVGVATPVSSSDSNSSQSSLSATATPAVANALMAVDDPESGDNTLLYIGSLFVAGLGVALFMLSGVLKRNF